MAVLRPKLAPPPRTALTCKYAFRSIAPSSLHVRSVGETIFRFRRERRAKPVADNSGKHSHIGALAELPREDGFRVVFTERRFTRQGEVHDRGEREIVGSRTLLLTQQLLGRGECRCARRSRRIFTGDVGDAEIGDAPTMVAVDQNVLRLEIAMQNSIRV